MKIAVMGTGAVSFAGGVICRSWRSCSGLRQCYRCTVGEADRQLRLQCLVGNHADALRPPRPGRWGRMRDAGCGGECLAVAHAGAVTVPGDVWESVQLIARTMSTQSFSTAQDLARGRRSEIDRLNGHVMHRGEALGVATPVNRVLYALVKLI